MKRHLTTALFAVIVLSMLGGCGAGIRNTKGMRLNAPRNNPNVEIQPVVINQTPRPIFIKIHEDNRDYWQVDPGRTHHRRMKTHETLRIEVFTYGEGFDNTIGDSKRGLELIKTGLYTGEPIVVTDMMLQNRTLQQGCIFNLDAYPMRITAGGRKFGMIPPYGRTPLFDAVDGVLLATVEIWQGNRLYKEAQQIRIPIDKEKGDQWVDLGKGYLEPVDWHYSVTVDR
ncbi:hypothetical protein HON36_05010 [Candidatus Parcubacteria bacterium]|jgi:hypothetical protein|nr:hypothetical protein [Candidatus Parcubacteria bacterium]MBT7228391.1 hypothetical protein [Candidatus Parcubacteria bacterium]